MDGVIGLPQVIALILGIVSVLSFTLGFYFRVEANMTVMSDRLTAVESRLGKAEAGTSNRFTSDNAKDMKEFLQFQIDNNKERIDNLNR
jgi:hypothetical protein